MRTHIFVRSTKRFALWAASTVGMTACGGTSFSLSDAGFTADASDETIVVNGDDATMDGPSGATNADAADAGEGATASDGGCTAPTTLSCNGVCVNPADPSHCGSCSNVCAGPTAGSGMAHCTLELDGGGECSVQCSVTSQLCGTACYALTDPNHCGACGTVCWPPASGKGQASCSASGGTSPACGVTCIAGYHACDGDCLSNTDEPSVTMDPCVLSETFGVFVSPAGNDTAGMGTQARPYKTIGHAMDAAAMGGTKRVYACGNAGVYAENLTVGASRDGVSVYGGLDCTTLPPRWTYNASLVAAVSAPSVGYALQVKGLTTGTTFEDVSFRSVAPTVAGVSSVAVFVTGSQNVKFERVSMTAGSASAAVGTAGADGGTAGNASNHYAGSLNGSSTTTTTGAAVTTCTCPDATSSTGGAGGDSSHAPGVGTPSYSGGTGTAGMNNSACGGTGALGGGGSGGDGPGGVADTPSTTLGTLSSTGWAPATGVAGSNGKVGQGGGGGGDGSTNTGAGGGGACGGCGGTGGGPGSGGGSSVALLSFDSIVSLVGCTLTSGDAGAGGPGGSGEAGQIGGNGGSQASGGCPGGAGGSGAGGNGAQGGPGGLSLGIGYSGTTPSYDMATTFHVGAEGAGGAAGGAGSAVTGNNGLGASGVAGAVGAPGVALNTKAL